MSKIRYQSIQVHIKVFAPKSVVSRLTHKFFLEVLESKILGDDVPGVYITYLVWDKGGRFYEYDDEENAIDALTKAIKAFGLRNIVKSLKVQYE